jgi:hypothetical protein
MVRLLFKNYQIKTFFFRTLFLSSINIKYFIGMNKMVINHLERLFVTSDAATIIKESDIHHPAAKMIAMAAKM